MLQSFVATIWRGGFDHFWDESVALQENFSYVLVAIKVALYAFEVVRRDYLYRLLPHKAEAIKESLEEESFRAKREGSEDVASQ